MDGAEFGDAMVVLTSNTSANSDDKPLSGSRTVVKSSRFTSRWNLTIESTDTTF